MCADEGNAACEDCACRQGEPDLMKRMADVLAVDGMLTGEARAAAAKRCDVCEDKDVCRYWLPLAEIRGAEHAPRFCLNADLFDELASEAPATL